MKAANQYRQIADAWATSVGKASDQLHTVKSDTAKMAGAFLSLAEAEKSFFTALENIPFPTNIRADGKAMDDASQVLYKDELLVMADLAGSGGGASFNSDFKTWSTDWDARMAADKLLKRTLSIT
jgi:hypothetical protein